MAGRKIFPQSVRLDEIKTVWYRETHARARGFQTCPGFFFVFLCSVFWFQGPLAAPLFHVVVPLTGGESLFFSVFFFLVFLVTGMQLGSMSPHNVNSRAPQVGRGKKRHTTQSWLLPASRGQMCTCVMFAGSCRADHLSTCTEHTVRTGPGGCVNTWRHGNLSPAKEIESNVTQQAPLSWFNL